MNNDGKLLNKQKAIEKQTQYLKMLTPQITFQKHKPLFASQLKRHIFHSMTAQSRREKRGAFPTVPDVCVRTDLSHLGAQSETK